MKKSDEFVYRDDFLIELPSGFIVDVESILASVKNTNKKFRRLKRRTEEMDLNIFNIVDFRMLSGLVGETLISDLAEKIDELEKNPNIDGYPDLVDVSNPRYHSDFVKWRKRDMKKFIKYPHGGIEVKNTFGTKKQNSDLLPGHRRITGINNKPDWKAHHRYTNRLLALFSDFIDECPQIVAVMYSDRLREVDWKEKQNPKEGSTMTSFSVIEKSGWLKLKAGLLICNKQQEYKDYFGC